MLPMQGTQVQSLVGELRSHMPKCKCVCVRVCVCVCVCKFWTQTNRGEDHQVQVGYVPQAKTSSVPPETGREKDRIFLRSSGGSKGLLTA